MDSEDGIGCNDWKGRLRERSGGEVSIYLDRDFDYTDVGHVKISEWTLNIYAIYFSM